jgi:hypothetical protein
MSLQQIVDAVLEFLFSAPKGSVRRKHQRATLLAIFLGVLIAAIFGAVLIFLNRSQRF